MSIEHDSSSRLHSSGVQCGVLLESKTRSRYGRSISLRLVAGCLQSDAFPPLATARETHLNFLPDKIANQAKFVIIFLGVVGWVERHSVNNH